MQNLKIYIVLCLSKEIYSNIHKKQTLSPAGSYAYLPFQFTIVDKVYRTHFVCSISRLMSDLGHRVKGIYNKLAQVTHPDR